MTTRRFLVTAGNTREMIDRVRDWGNVFTGNTGFAIAQALAAHGEVERSDVHGGGSDLLPDRQCQPVDGQGVRAG